MRFLADMGADVRVVQRLNEHGHDAIHLRDEQLHRLPNGEIFEKAAREARILLTFDLDFGEIAALAHGRPVTVFLFPLHNTRAAHVIEKLEGVLRASLSALRRPAVVLVEESRHRTGICRSARPSREPEFFEDNENKRSRRRMKLEGWLNRISWLRPNWRPVPFLTARRVGDLPQPREGCRQR